MFNVIYAFVARNSIAQVYCYVVVMQKIQWKNKLQKLGSKTHIFDKNLLNVAKIIIEHEKYIKSELLIFPVSRIIYNYSSAIMFHKSFNSFIIYAYVLHNTIKTFNIIY